MQLQWNLTNGANVVGHILTHFAITPRCSLNQYAVLIAQAHGQAIKFKFGHIFHCGRAFPQAQFFADAGVKRFGTTCLGVGFSANAEHRQGVFDTGKALKGLPTHTLRGRVGRDQFRVCGLKLLKRLEQAVVLGVGERGCVQHMVKIPVVVQLGPQLGSLFSN